MSPGYWNKLYAFAPVWTAASVTSPENVNVHLFISFYNGIQGVVYFILFYFFEADVTRRLYGVCLNPFELMQHVEIMFGIFGYCIKFGFCFLLFLLPLPTLKPWLIQLSSVVLIMLPFTLANEAIQETCIPVSAHLQFTCRSSHMQKPGFQSSRDFRHTNRLDFFE